MESVKVGVKLAPYNPTNNDAIDIALHMLNIRSNETIYDLGCGDARFLVSACKLFTSIRGTGVEYDHDIYIKARNNVSSNNLDSQINIVHDNVLNVDFSDASVLFIYLVPEGILKLKASLVDALSRGVRIVTYVFSIPGIVPTKVSLYKGSTKIYLYQQDHDSVDTVGDTLPTHISKSVQADPVM